MHDLMYLVVSTSCAARASGVQCSRPRESPEGGYLADVRELGKLRVREPKGGCPAGRRRVAGDRRPRMANPHACVIDASKMNILNDRPMYLMYPDMQSRCMCSRGSPPKGGYLAGKRCVGDDQRPRVGDDRRPRMANQNAHDRGRIPLIADVLGHANLLRARIKLHVVSRLACFWKIHAHRYRVEHVDSGTY